MSARLVSIEVPSDVSLTGVYWNRADSFSNGAWSQGAPFFASSGFAAELWRYFKWIARKSGKKLVMKLTRTDSDGVAVVGYYDSSNPVKSYDPPAEAT
jgi:hypothetical protein